MPLRLGYLIPQFPGQTHIFFWRELEALQARGVQPVLLSTRPPPPGLISHEWSAEATARTTYLGRMDPLAALGGLVRLPPGDLLSAPRGEPRAFLRDMAMSIPAARRLVDHARREGIDHVHAHSCGRAALIAALAFRMGGPRYSLTLHGPLEDYVWFAGFKSCDGKVQSIGVLKQNPLGFFDILGNVQELTAGLYRLRTREQLHGQAGGLVARGGSCLTAEARMRSSDRDEIAPYDDKTGAPRGKVFTGLRLAFGAPILSSAERISTINEDWRVSGEMRLPLEPGQDPVEALGIIAEAEPDARVRDALLNARDLFQREMTQRNAVEGRSAASVAQGGMLAVRSYLLALQDLANSRELLASNPDDRDFRDYVARAEERRQLTENVLLAGIVHAAEDFSDQTYSAAAHVVAQENEARLAGMRARTRVSTMRMHDLFGQFVGTYRKHPDTDPQEFLNQIEALRVELSQLQD